MTNEQFQQVAAQDWPDQSAAVRENVLAELATLASTNPDPIPDDEFEALVRHLVFKHRKAEQDAAAAADNPGAVPGYVAPAETLVPQPITGPNASLQAGALNNFTTAWNSLQQACSDPGLANSKNRWIYDGASAEADQNEGIITLNLEESGPDGPSYRRSYLRVLLRISAASEIIAALGFALDELLTPGVDCGWVNGTAFGAVCTLNDPAAAEAEVVGEVFRSDETGLYNVKLYLGIHNPDGAVLAAVPTLELAKFELSKLARPILEARGQKTDAAPAASAE
jgi:hypothetical protein